MRDLRIGGIYRKLSLVPAGFIGADLGAIRYGHSVDSNQVERGLEGDNWSRQCES